MVSVSCYFQKDDDVVWNPSNSLTRAFIGQADALSQLVGKETGLGEIVEDECHINTAVFGEFLDALAQTYRDSRNEALRALLTGFLSVSLALAERIGLTLPFLGTESADMWAIQREISSRSMPR
ncbi:DUF6086 family protein [Streptomyces sp. NPDC057413]|uniref:DUF6086 family protein n=1 Tax=Streptomyces sp. NPDC057413 TaxID=3346124 RepID=UPI003679AF6C